MRILRVFTVGFLLISLIASVSAAEHPWEELPEDAAHWITDRMGVEELSPQDWYLVELQKAFRRLIPQEQDNDQVDRLMKAILEGDEGRAERDQILGTYRIADLRSYLYELDGRIDKDRSYLTGAERRFDGESTPFSEIQQARSDYTAKKITADEVAVLIHFYQWKDAREARNQLIERRGLMKVDSETARYAVSVVRWPHIEIRVHDQNLPKVPYTRERQKAWQRVSFPFLALGKRYELAQIWSQLVNLNSGNRRFRYLDGFEDRFLLEVRDIALNRNDEFRARNLLLAYMTNYATSDLLARVGIQKNEWDETEQKLEGRSLGYFLVRLEAVKDRATLRRFFTDATLPRTFPQTRSKIYERVIRVLSTAFQHEKKTDCLAALAAMEDSLASPDS